MSHRSAIRLVVLAGALIGGTYGGARWYSSWRFDRDFRAAEQALSAYDFPLAREHLAECEARRPNVASVQLLTCRAARRAGDLDAAETYYSRYRELNPESNPDALLERALLDAQHGRIGEVVDYLIGHLEAKSPRSEEIMEALAMGCVSVYNLDRAGFWITELLALAPKNPIGRLLKAQTLCTLGNADQAIALLRDLIRDFPKGVDSRLTLGSMLLTTNQPQEAASTYGELRAQHPGDARALLGLTRTLFRLGKTNETRELVPELEKLGDNSEALFFLGRLAVLEQRWTDGERFLSRAVQLAPSHVESQRDLGVCLYQLGKSDEAKRHTDRAREIEIDLAKLEKVLAEMFRAPRDPGPRLEAARLCLRNGQNSECLRWLQGALEIAPNHKPTHEALAEYYAANGNPELAAYHRALAK